MTDLEFAEKYQCFDQHGETCGGDCDECKDNFLKDLAEHDAKIRAEVIEEVKESINEHLFNSPMMNPIMTRNEILLFLEQLKEQK